MTFCFIYSINNITVCLSINTDLFCSTHHFNKTATFRSRLLLTNSGCSFAFIPLPSMSLSSLNRSNPSAFRPIMPYSSPVCEGMHYHKSGVPWQIKSIFIIYINLPRCRNFPLFLGFLWFHRDIFLSVYLVISSHIFAHFHHQKLQNKLHFTEWLQYWFSAFPVVFL